MIQDIVMTAGDHQYSLPVLLFWPFMDKDQKDSVWL